MRGRYGRSGVLVPRSAGDARSMVNLACLSRLSVSWPDEPERWIRLLA